MSRPSGTENPIRIKKFFEGESVGKKRINKKSVGSRADVKDDDAG